MAEMLRNPDTNGAASRHWFRTLVLAMSSAVLVWGASLSSDLGRQLEAAIHREVVLGDMAGAMQEYRKILAQAGVPEPIASRARMGLARTRLASWIGPRNLDFSEGQAGKVPPAPWAVQAPADDAGYVAELRRDGCRSQTGCAVVTAPVNVPGQAGDLKQSFSAAAYRGKTVRFRGWLKLEQFFVTAFGGVRALGADDRAQLWVSVERTNGQIGFSDSMDHRPVRSSNWSPAEIVGQIDPDARTVHLGVMSFGGARAWVDELSFEVIEK